MREAFIRRLIALMDGISYRLLRDIEPSSLGYDRPKQSAAT